MPTLRENGVALKLHVLLVLLSLLPVHSFAKQTALLVDLRSMEENALGAPYCAFNFPFDFVHVAQPPVSWVDDVLSLANLTQGQSKAQHLKDPELNPLVTLMFPGYPSVSSRLA